MAQTWKDGCGNAESEGVGCERKSEIISDLNMVMYYKAADAPAVEKLLTFDPDSVEGRPPSSRSERYPLKDDLLLASRTDKTPLSFTLRTGHRLTGVVRWVTAYDVGLTLDNGAKVHVFKHAISDCQPQR